VVAAKPRSAAVARYMPTTAQYPLLVHDAPRAVANWPTLAASFGKLMLAALVHLPPDWVRIIGTDGPALSLVADRDAPSGGRARDR